MLPTHVDADMADELHRAVGQSNGHGHGHEEVPEPVKARAPRQFIEIRKRGENVLNSNLTELNAAHAVEKGFVTHNDWIAHTLRYAYAAKYIQKAKARTVLDVGCGNLQLPYFCWRNRIPGIQQYVGIDLRATPKWLDEVGWNSPMALIRADIVLDYADIAHNIKGLGFAEAQAEVVVCFEAFEHVPNDQKPRLMYNLFRWTRPGGTLLFSTPNAGVSDSTAHNHTDPETGESREMSFQGKLELASEVGFTLQEVYGTFCGITRIPEHKEILKESAILKAAKEFLPHAWYTCVVAAAYPEHSNNALMVFRRPG